MERKPMVDFDRANVFAGHLLIITMALALGLSSIYQKDLTIHYVPKVVGYILLAGATFLVVSPLITYIRRKLKGG